MLRDPKWDDDDAIDLEDRPSKWRWYRRAGLATVVAVGVIMALRSGLLDSGKTLAKHEPPPLRVELPKPLPPPPPPKPPEKPPEPQKLEPPKPTQQQLPDNKPQQPKPAQPKPANPTSGPKPLQSNLGPGTDAYKLGGGSGDGSSSIGGDGTGGGGGGGGVGYGFYAVKVQSQLQAALTRSEKTRRGTYRAVALLWLSSTGRIERAELAKSTGNVEIDNNLLELLRGQVLNEPPPAGMPEPITTTINARG